MTNIRNNEFDPDSLHLNKDEILEFCDNVIKNWQQQTTSDSVRNVVAMTAVRSAVFFTDEESLKAIWSEIILWVYQLLYDNAMASDKQEPSSWANTRAKLAK